MIVTFVGHAKFSAKEEYREKINNLLCSWIGDKKAEFYLGGYGEFDQFALRCGTNYKMTHPQVVLVYITPYMDESFQRNHLKEIEKQYDRIEYPNLERVPPKYAILRRNQYMVDCADIVVAYIDHMWGGAYQTYRYAKQKKKTVINLFSGI